MSDLLPCPFCGTSAGFPDTARTGGHYAACNDCGAEGPFSRARSEATELWNRLAPINVQSEVDAMRQVFADRDAALARVAELLPLAYETRPGMETPAVTWQQHSQNVLSSLYALQSERDQLRAELETYKKQASDWERFIAELRAELASTKDELNQVRLALGDKEPKYDPHAECKAAHARGERIEYLFRNCWIETGNPIWAAALKYRIAK